MGAEYWLALRGSHFKRLEMVSLYFTDTTIARPKDVIPPDNSDLEDCVIYRYIIGSRA